MSMTRRAGDAAEPGVEDEADLSGLAAPRGVVVLGVVDADAEAGDAGVLDVVAMTAFRGW
jgi:hypothetical protein